MALFQRWYEKDCLIGIWRMDETEEQLRSLLPEELVRQASRFTAPHRRMEWLSVRLLLQTLLGSSSPEIQYTAAGAPFLSDHSCSISISHTRGYVTVLLAPPCRRVGIDIEQWGERVCKIASRFVRDDEEIQLFRESPVASLLLHWSAKETLFKCMEVQDGVDFKQHLRLFPFTLDSEGSLVAQEFRSPGQRTYAVRFRIYPDFVLTWTDSE